MDSTNTIIFDTKTNFSGAVDYIRDAFLMGEVFAFPTETVYGLGCDIKNQKAVDFIYELKGRRRDNPLSVYIPKPEIAAGLCSDIPGIFYSLAHKFLPGPLAIVMKKRDGVPDYINSGMDTIAIRIPDHPFMIELLTSLCRPLVGTSANISGQPAPKSFKEVIDTFSGKIHIAVNGGDCPLGKESTIISLAEKEPALLREGSLPKAEIEGFLGLKLKDNRVEVSK